MQVTRAALPHLRQQCGGRVIQISTYGGQAANPGGSLYNASKFGIEGFMEALAKEVGVFGIEVTIVEPGGARTDFRHRSAQLGQPLEAYDDTPAAFVRELRDPARLSQGDPAKMASLIIASGDEHPAPQRLVLGSDPYRYVHTALTQRLASIQGQEERAASTDVPVG